MSSSGEFGAMYADEARALARIISLAFAGTREGSLEWLEKAGHQHMRVYRQDQTAAGCLLRIPMGQYFGGSSVPLVGIAAVGVTPESRGRGTAKRMMAAALREMYDEGTPLSGLYASTQSLYRSAGYEQAGHRFEIRLPVAAIDVRERGMPVRELGEGDENAVKACYGEFARVFNGPLDRGAYLWGRVRQGRDGEYTGLAALGESASIEGYVYLRINRKPERGRQEIVLSDLAFSTVGAGRRLLGLLADFGSMADDVVFFGGPMHPALFLLGQQRFRIDLRDHWMLRIVNVARALEARGYAPGVTARVLFDVRDGLLGENQGRWALRVEDGRGRVERGGSAAAISLDVSAMAPLYSGYMSASQLRWLGRIEGTDEAVRMCDAVFAGTTPWMGDMY